MKCPPPSRSMVIPSLRRVGEIAMEWRRERGGRGDWTARPSKKRFFFFESPCLNLPTHTDKIRKISSPDPTEWIRSKRLRWENMRLLFTHSVYPYYAPPSSSLFYWVKIIFASVWRLHDWVKCITFLLFERIDELQFHVGANREFRQGGGCKLLKVTCCLHLVCTFII